MISWFMLALTVLRLHRAQVNSCYKGMNGERQWRMSRILYILAGLKTAEDYGILSSKSVGTLSVHHKLTGTQLAA